MYRSGVGMYQSTEVMYAKVSSIQGTGSYAIFNNLNLLESGCGSVGRAVAFDTRGPRFDSSHRQNFIEHLFIINS